MDSMEEKLEAAQWVAHTLFQKGMVTGSTGNISFLQGDRMYISCSGSCFGKLDQDSFAIVELSGKILSGKPSKEYPLHLALYRNNKQHQAVIHTHSLYTTALSCRRNIDQAIQELFAYTPYLAMQTKGSIKQVAYAEPGSDALFAAFQAAADEQSKVYLLRNHGIVVTAADMDAAFAILEEFEISAKLQHLLHCYDKTALQTLNAEEWR